jgi:uncharacterized protein
VPKRLLPVPDPPQELGRRDGLAYALFLPHEPTAGGVVILHGASSCKESHFDFARALRGHGIAALAFDQRGHGESEGALDGGALEDVATMAALLPPGPLALRGSSMGGYLALVAAGRLGARAVVAICPAGADRLRHMLATEELEFRVDHDSFDALLAEHDLMRAVGALDCPLLLMHAEGDERVPVEHSRALLDAARTPDKRLIAVPGGHHRSVQHDPELQSFSVRFIARALARGRPPGR